MATYFDQRKGGVTKKEVTYDENRFVEVSYVCDLCKIGLMEVMGIVSDIQPNQKHKCSNCDNIDTYDRLYPYIERKLN